MSNGLEAVARGLRVTRVAFRVTVLFAVLFVGLFLAVGVFGSDFLRTNTTLGVIYGVVMCGAGLAAVVGMMVGFAGRCRCLGTPAAFPAARSRIRLAVILEGCGWLSGLANLTVVIGNSLLALRCPAVVFLVTTALSCLLLIAGRVMFLWYSRSLADAAGNDSLARLAARSLVVFVAVAASAVVAAVPVLVVSANNTAGASTAVTFADGFGGGLWFAACGIGVYGLVVYARLLRRLADNAAALAPLVGGAGDDTPEGAA